MCKFWNFKLEGKQGDYDSKNAIAECFDAAGGNSKDPISHD